MTTEHPAADERGEVGRAPLDVAVIGGGQAGLAIGQLLAQQGRRLAIFEAGPAVGSAWRGRWDSLVLFTPRRYDALPGMAFPGDPDGYPGRDEVVAYLEAYARRFELPVLTDQPVRSLRSREGGGFVLESERGDVEAAQVVVATGPFQAPHTPAFAAGLDPGVFQIHATGYRRPSDVPAGRVLVVGGGNTGFQIAQDLAPTHQVALAIGSRQTPLPQRLLGRDLFWWLTRTGLLAKTVDSRIGRRARGRDTLIGSSPRRLRRRGVTLRPRVVGASGRTVTFAGGDVASPDAIVWATGFRSDHSWIDLPVIDGDGRLRHRRGVTDVPGLYFLGLSWQHTRGSALLGFIEDDARFIAERVDEHARSHPHAARSAAPHTEV
jgi:putative flavoprotein involved in K+ transport